MRFFFYLFFCSKNEELKNVCIPSKKKEKKKKKTDNIPVISARVVCCWCEILLISMTSSSKSPFIHESGELFDPARDDGYGDITFTICGRPLFGKLRLFRYLKILEID